MFDQDIELSLGEWDKAAVFCKAILQQAIAEHFPLARSDVYFMRLNKLCYEVYVPEEHSIETDCETVYPIQQVRVTGFFMKVRRPAVKLGVTGTIS